MRVIETLMAFDLSMDDQATALFLTEAGELCQQFEEGLLLLTHEPSPLNLQKIARSIQAIYQGAGQVGLEDLQLLSLGLSLLLEGYGVNSAQGEPITSELLHHFCDSLQWSLIVHRSMSDRVEHIERREFVLHALMPKALEIMKLIFAQPLGGQVQRQLLQQQTQWIQWWSNVLDLAELRTIAEATLNAIATHPAIAAVPSVTEAIATVAMAGFQVAHHATLERLNLLLPTPETDFTEPQTLDSVGRTLGATLTPTTLDLSQHLAGLAYQTIFCAATQSIEEIVLPQPNQQIHQDGQKYLRWKDHLIVLHRFVDLWPPSRAVEQSRVNPSSAELILVLKHEPFPVAIALDVDRLIVEPELSLSQPPSEVAPPHPCRCGWTCTSEGPWIEVIDINCLIQVHLRPDPSPIHPMVMPERQPSRVQAWEPPMMVLSPVPAASTLKTILVVDDSKTIREILSLALQEAGYGVVQAKDGQEAIAHLQQQSEIHLTICDLEMSNLNGFEFLRHRLQDEQWIQIPVLILSSHTSDEYRQLAQKLGAADYLTIPYDPLILLKTIQNLLKP
jgi:CheY-like chemotaxis protein